MFAHEIIYMFSSPPPLLPAPLTHALPGLVCGRFPPKALTLRAAPASNGPGSPRPPAAAAGGRLALSNPAS